ncbi:hypothetical protein DYB37_013030 [Aphanomyces astaci]|uniref:Uncharacterized protein n=1 Tax=Aphanomyces astaci TaxID=112090 RepID=A0A418FQS2_APHAT|nr:hypothetical protein DYB37_013030 [Aphanomyces astaci]
MTKHSEHVARLKSKILVAGGASPNDVSPVVAVFGEWCGDTIQSGVALAQLPKMFVVFAASVNHKWVNMTALPRIVVENEPAGIYHIHTFGGWTINIDFNLPESSQPELERLTALVEAECPAAKYFGVTGVGEGIVWNCVAAGYTNLKFKVKGELHANPGPTIGKGKTKAAATHPDVVQSIQAFVDEYVSEARLHQELTILDESGLPRSLMSMGYFIK